MSSVPLTTRIQQTLIPISSWTKDGIKQRCSDIHESRITASSRDRKDRESTIQSSGSRASFQKYSLYCSTSARIQVLCRHLMIPLLKDPDTAVVSVVHRWMDLRAALARPLSTGPSFSVVLSAVRRRRYAVDQSRAWVCSTMIRPAVICQVNLAGSRRRLADTLITVDDRRKFGLTPSICVHSTVV